MRTLQGFDSVGGHANYNFQFALRFDLVYHRALYIILEDAWSISQHLSSLKGDPSLQTSQLAEAYRQMTIKDSEEMLETLKPLIAKCAEKKLVRLEIEFHITSLQFRNLVNRAKKITSSQTPPATMTRASYLCRTYPDTAGKYLPLLTNARAAIDQSRKLTYPEANESRVLEHALGSHVCGHLTTCANKHPYSSKMFKSCPECGRKVQQARQTMDGSYEKHMKEDEFILKMGQRSPPRSYSRSPRAGSKSPPRVGSKSPPRAGSLSPAGAATQSTTRAGSQSPPHTASKPSPAAVSNV
jgi:hypothetical protein